ncbi:PIG-L deacetylase family protein [Gemmatimonas sp.]|uniref:PIG-L deacetylase family protein n=1 Tax=Gemmatimonas sp. TaxID=1962908 RepID=UPI00286BF361|nr:PIG-L deacetylase family protein [Gemmatimonas sp.]
MSNVLVVVAHPDDEVLGCGGTMARYAREGHTVHVAMLADGIGARRPTAALTLPDDAAALVRRRAAAERAGAILGVASTTFGDFPDNRMDLVPLLDVAREVERLVTQFQPGIVLTHHAGDVNIDHRRIHEAVVTACRPQPGHPVHTVLTFEVASSTEWQFATSAPVFAPSWFVDISDTLALQQEALAAYAEELRPWPHPRSPEALRDRARWRGASIGVEAAEAFMLGRHIVSR